MPGTGNTTVISCNLYSVHGSKHLENVEALDAEAGWLNSQVSVTLMEVGVIFVFH